MKLLLKKQHVNKTLQLGGVIFIFLISTVFNACQKENIQTSEISDNCEYEIDENRMAVIDSISQLYHSEFKSVLTILKQKSGIIDANEFAQTFTDSFNKKIEKLSVNTRLNLKNSENVSSDTLELYLQTYLDDFAYQANNDSYAQLNKNDYLLAINNIVDNCITSITANPDLRNIQKQLIIENIVLRSNIFKTYITFGDEFSFSISDKSSNKKCGWVCRNRKKIACTIATISAAGICATSVAAIISGNFAVGGLVGINCYNTAKAAIECWKNI